MYLFDEVDALSGQTQHIFEQIFIARNELGVSLPFGHSLLGLTDSLSPRRVIPGQRSALSTGLGGSTQVSELLAGLLKCQDAPVRKQLATPEPPSTNYDGSDGQGAASWAKSGARSWAPRIHQFVVSR